MGYSKAFLTYMDILMKKSAWTQCFGDSLDQAHHNYVLYNKGMKEAGIKVAGLDCNSEILTCHFCCKYAKCSLNNNTNIFFGNNTDRAPIIVHQYNRLEYLESRKNFFCPGNFRTLYENQSLADAADARTFERLPPIRFPLPDKLS